VYSIAARGVHDSQENRQSRSERQDLALCVYCYPSRATDLDFPSRSDDDGNVVRVQVCPLALYDCDFPSSSVSLTA